MDKKIKYMSIGEKLFEIIKQIVLLFVSILAEVCCIGYGIIGGFYLGAKIMENIYEAKTIKYTDESNKGRKYEVYDSGYWKTQSHDIKNSEGEVIGTIEEKTEYVDGEFREQIDSGERCIYFEGSPILHAFISLPCRIISLILSFVALFIPCLYVSAFVPKYFRDNNLYPYPYNDKNKPIKEAPFAYIDLIIVN